MGALHALKANRLFYPVFTLGARGSFRTVCPFTIRKDYLSVWAQERMSYVIKLGLKRVKQFQIYYH